MKTITKEEAIKDIEELLADSKEDKYRTKNQAFYILGRLYLYAEYKIITHAEHNRLYERMCKQFGFTLEDHDSVRV